MDDITKDMIPRKAVEYCLRKETVSTNPYEHKYHDKFIQFMDDPEISDFGRWQHSNGFNTALVAVKCDLDKVPSVPPKQPGWIPCSERLPETATDVLVCNDDGKCGVAIMQTQDFYGHSEKEWNIKYCLYDWDVWDDRENGRIVAWMPLPAKPWEEEKAEGAATP